MTKNIKYVCISLLLLVSFQGYAFDCESQTSGFWNTASTWINCNNTVPQNDDSVVIKNTHTVSLSSATNNLESLYIEAGGDLNVFLGTAPIVVINANNTTTSSIDLSNASLVLQNNLTINAFNKNIWIGMVDGDFDLVLNSSAETHLTNTIGGNVPVKSITTESMGTTFFADPNGGTNISTIIADAKIEIKNTAILFNDTTLQCSDGIIKFDGTIDSQDTTQNFAIKLSQNSIITFNGNIGSVSELDLLTIFNSNGAVVNINTSEIKTRTYQKWDLNVVLNSPTQNVLMSSSIGSEIRFGNPSRIYSVRSNVMNVNSLTIDTSGPVKILSKIGDNNQPLNNFFIINSSMNTLSQDIINVSDTVSLTGPVLLSHDLELSGKFIINSGNLDNGGFNLTINTNDPFGSGQILGVISGTGGLIKKGVGNLDLAAINDTTGNLFVNEGAIATSNASENVIPNVPVISVAAQGTFVLNSDNTGVYRMQAGQKIEGTGTLLQSVVAPATAVIEPGLNIGKLTVTELLMETNAQFNVELGGLVAGNDYDQLNVTQVINLDADNNNGAILNVTLINGYVPAIGDSFIIVDNLGTSFTNGQFQNLAEGAAFSTNGTLFSITYIGGDGNDVVLTALGSSILYVNENVAVAGDGSSWTSAFDNLQDALAVAIPGQEIWVAQGVYYPDVGGMQMEDDDTATFSLIEGVSIYGGFNGSEISLNQRNPDNNITILSGDITQDDTNLDGNFITEDVDTINGVNSKNVVNGSQVTTATFLDGFTITAGSAISSTDPTDRGAGMYCGFQTSGPSINQVKFIGNYTRKRGSGIYGCTQSVNNSSFVNNVTLDLGGAVLARGGFFNHVTFSGNRSNVTGGALRNDSSPIIIKNSEFIANESQFFDGGAITTTADITLENVLFKGNKAGTGSGDNGGALDIRNTSTANLINTTFTGNNAGDMGGAISISATATLNITNSIIWNNADASGVGTASSSINVPAGGVVNNSYSLIQGFGTSGVSNLDEDPLFVTATDPTTAPTTVGDAHLTEFSMAIDIGDNTAVNETNDLDNLQRIRNGTVDMGAYEYFEEQIFKDGFE